MKKQQILIVVLSFLFCTLMLQPAYAASTSNIYYPQWTYLSNSYQNLNIDSSGKASVFASTQGKAGVQSVKVEASLQQYKNGNWTTIKSWSASKAGVTVSLSKEWYVQKGYSYRWVSVHTAYHHGSSESSIMTSPTVKY